MKDKTEKKIYTVYTITYQGRVMYVGKTCDFERRVKEHRGKRGTYISAIPTDADLNDVTFMPIETYTTDTDALRREDGLIQEYDTINTGWNKQRSGLIYSSDTKAYMREMEKTDKRKAYQHEYQREYRKTDKQKAYHREWMREYRNTEKSKEYQREYMRKYRLRKKAEKLAI